MEGRLQRLQLFQNSNTETDAISFKLIPFLYYALIVKPNFLLIMPEVKEISRMKIITSSIKLVN